MAVLGIAGAVSRQQWARLMIDRRSARLLHQRICCIGLRTQLKQRAGIGFDIDQALSGVEGIKNRPI
jgi:hypothetical protein